MDKKKKQKVCLRCDAICCKNLAVGILKPVTRVEIEDLKWQLHFDTVRVFIRNRRWYQLIEGRCIYLDKDSLCKIYHDRTDRCRRHNPPHCEKYGAFYDVLFSCPKELDNYLKKKVKVKK